MREKLNYFEIISLSCLCSMIPGSIIIILASKFINIHFSLLWFVTPFIFIGQYYYSKIQRRISWIEWLYHWMNGNIVLKQDMLKEKVVSERVKVPEVEEVQYEVKKIPPRGYLEELKYLLNYFFVGIFGSVGTVHHQNFWRVSKLDKELKRLKTNYNRMKDLIPAKAVKDSYNFEVTINEMRETLTSLNIPAKKKEEEIIKLKKQLSNRLKNYQEQFEYEE